MPKRLDAENTAAAKRFGAAVRTARDELGLTAAEVIKSIYASGNLNIKTAPSHLLALERNGGTPQTKMFFLLCEALGLDPYDFGFTGDMLSIIEEREYEKRRHAANV